MCENVTYDYENIDDPDYTLKFSAYAALIHKTAICQGYGTLMYRILNEVDVDTRFVAGFDDNGVDHGWNLVEVDGSYYYIDATWDAGSEEYEYFLKGESDFVDHTPTSEFLDSYDIAESEYVKGEEVIVLPLTDVEEDKWYYESVKYVYENGLMYGTSETTFAPNDTLTRAMFATILYRANDEPEVEYEETFVDVPEGEWYSDGIIWAYQNGIIYGYGDGIFGTNDNITREQLAAMMYRYGEYMGYDMSEYAELDQYEDADMVSSWAEEAISWAVGANIIYGTSDTTLNPTGQASRAECAAIIMRFILHYEA